MAIETSRKPQSKRPPSRPGQNKRTAGKAVLHRAYYRLIEKFPLRPIRSERELDQAITLVDQLLSRKEPLLPEEKDYLDVLSDLIERFEDEHVPIPDLSAAEMLRFLIEQRGVKQQTVAKESGIANSTISAVLKGDRELTRNHIVKLAAYFSVEPALFLPGNN